MLEISRVVLPVTGYFGRPEALDSIENDAEISIRVASDELLVIGQTREVDRPDGVFGCDLTSGYALWQLTGETRFEALSRLTELTDVTGEVAQGLVAHVPAKVIFLAESLIIVVSSTLAHHVRNTLLLACNDIDVEARASIHLTVAALR